jgi:hypothetical protein
VRNEKCESLFHHGSRFSWGWFLVNRNGDPAGRESRLTLFAVHVSGHPVAGRQNSAFLGAVSAAVKRSMALHTVADDAAAAVIALGGHPVDGALEAIKDVPLLVARNLDALVVLVSAGFTSWHGRRPFHHPARPAHDAPW